MKPVEEILHISPERGLTANCYILELPSSSIVIDPSQELFSHHAIKQALNIQLFATHGHFDHVLAVDKWREKFPCQLSIHEAEQKLLSNVQLNASYMTPLPCDYKPAELTFIDGQRIDLGDAYSFKIIHTPGHTKGGSCLLLSHEDSEEPLLLFSGDTLFRASVGRSDLPTGDPQVLQKSLKKLIKAAAAWPPDLPVYPGHGPATTIPWEISHNPWL